MAKDFRNYGKVKNFLISLHMLEPLNFLFDIHYIYYITVGTFAFLRHFIHVLKKAYFDPLDVYLKTVTK